MRERPCLRGLLFCGLGFVARDAAAQGSQLPSVTVPPRKEPSTAVATDPSTRLTYRVGAALRLNPVGLFVTGSALYRKRLYEHSSPVLRDNYVGVGPVLFMSPSLGRGGLGVEVQPLSILQLSASFEGLGFFGT